MRAQNKKISNMIRVLLLGLPLFLTACHSDLGPFPMPSGYAHHGKEYKAQDGPEPVLKKIQHMRVAQSTNQTSDAVSADMVMNTDAVMVVPVGAGWDDAARDLVMRMIDNFGKPVEPVYVQPALFHVT